MANYKRHTVYDTTLILLKPETVTIKGSTKKLYPDIGRTIFCSFKSYGGTELLKNDVIAVEDTAIIETWYDPTITSDCRLKTADNAEYEILGTPENIDNRNQFMKFKIRRIRGGA